MEVGSGGNWEVCWVGKYTDLDKSECFQNLTKMLA